MTGYVWPLGRDATYTSPREYRAGLTLQDGSWWPPQWHYGCDWAADAGTPVRAAHSGNLSNLVEPAGAGNYVNIVDADGAHRTMYMHLDSFARDPGWVDPGDVIGYVGTTGASTGPHLHFQVHQPAGGWPSVEPIAWLILAELYDVPAYVYARLEAAGLSTAGAAGIMGNLHAESMMDPAIVEGMTHDPADLVPGVREGLGLLQWSFSRRERLVAYAHSERYLPWQLPEVQMDFLAIELAEGGPDVNVMLNQMQTTNDPAAAARYFSDVFVRPGVYGDRDTWAWHYYERILAGEFGTPTATAPTPAPAAPIVAVTPAVRAYGLIGETDMTQIIHVVGDWPPGLENTPRTWELSGVALLPFLDASLGPAPHPDGTPRTEADAGIYHQTRSSGTFLNLLIEHSEVTGQNPMTGKPWADRTRQAVEDALAKYNAA